MSMKKLLMLGVGAALLSVGFARPASAVPVLTTDAQELEVLTSPVPRTVTLQSPVVYPRFFTLPIDVMVVQDSSITTSTIITDAFVAQFPQILRSPSAYSQAIIAWGEQVRECQKADPALIRKVAGTKGSDGYFSNFVDATAPNPEVVPVVIDGAPGKLKLNANKVAVCTL